MLSAAARSSVLHALQIVRGDEQPVVVRQLVNRFLETIPGLELREGRVRHGGLDPSAAVRVRLQRHLGTTLSSRLRTHVLYDAIDPRRQPRVAPEVRQAPVDLQEHILCEVFRPERSGTMR